MDFLGGYSVITESFKVNEGGGRGGRIRERFEDATLLPLEEGAMSQRMQVGQRGRKRQGTGFFPCASRRNEAAQTSWL